MCLGWNPTYNGGGALHSGCELIVLYKWKNQVSVSLDPTSCLYPLSSTPAPVRANPKFGEGAGFDLPQGSFFTSIPIARTVSESSIVEVPATR